MCNQYNKTEAAVIFVGLKQIKYSLNIDNPLKFVDSIIKKYFDTQIVPTFTPSVLKTGVYDVRYTLSENGTFSNYFLKSSDYRTLSPFKSYAISGKLVSEIKQIQVFNDYLENGMFDYINRKNIISLNIGTIDVRPSTIHYCEYVSNVPYLKPRIIPVQIINENGNKSINNYYYLDYKRNVKFNRNKIERDLLKNGILTRLIVNDLVIRLINEQYCFEYLTNRLKKDPYYLIN